MSTLEIKSKTNFGVDPTFFNVLVFIVSITMLFAGLTSAYIVRKSAGNWVDFELPSVFIKSNIAIVLSSVFLVLANRFQKSLNIKLVRTMLTVTAIMAIAFIYFQWLGWVELSEQGVYLVGNPSGSFIFIITGLHIAHLTGGVVLLFIALMKTFTLPVNELKSIKLSALSVYWHFIGVLWIYLFIFFSYI